MHQHILDVSVNFIQYVCDQLYLRVCSPSRKLPELSFDLLMNLVIRLSLSEPRISSVCMSVCTQGRQENLGRLGHTIEVGPFVQGVAIVSDHEY